MIGIGLKQKIGFLPVIAAVIALAVYISISCSQNQHRKTVDIMIRQGALVVDVRTPAEFSSGHFSGAINIPLDEIEKKISLFGGKDKPVVVYCRSGNRSSRAKAILERHGFTKVENGGGLDDMTR